jgi:hypothetical protein
MAAVDIQSNGQGNDFNTGKNQNHPNTHEQK